MNCDLSNYHYCDFYSGGPGSANHRTPDPLPGQSGLSGLQPAQSPGPVQWPRPDRHLLSKTSLDSSSSCPAPETGTRGLRVQRPRRLSRHHRRNRCKQHRGGTLRLIQMATNLLWISMLLWQTLAVLKIITFSIFCRTAPVCRSRMRIHSKFAAVWIHI